MSDIPEAAEELTTALFFKSFGLKKINELVLAGKKLINNFACWLQILSRRKKPAAHQLDHSGLNELID
jgi:hypothetical protein